MKSANLKEGLLSYIYNPGNNPPPEPKHIDFTKRGSKLYKNTGDVFCLDDEDDDNVTELRDIEKKADTIHVTACQRVDETGLLSPCHLLVTSTHLTVLLPGSRHDDDILNKMSKLRVYKSLLFQSRHRASVLLSSFVKYCQDHQQKETTGDYNIQGI